MLHFSEHASRAGQETWSYPLQGRRVTTDPVHPTKGCPRDGLQQLCLLHPLSIALVLPVPLGSCFGWQWMFPQICMSSPGDPSLCCQEQKEKERFSCGGVAWLWGRVTSTADLCQSLEQAGRGKGRKGVLWANYSRSCTWLLGCEDHRDLKTHRDPPFVLKFLRSNCMSPQSRLVSPHRV